jgi:hypothetical protein
MIFGHVIVMSCTKEDADDTGNALPTLAASHGHKPPQVTQLFGKTPTPHPPVTPPWWEGHLLRNLSKPRRDFVYARA